MELGKEGMKMDKQTEDTKGTRFVLINYSVSRDEIASIHRLGCKDIKRDQMEHGGHIYPSKSSVDKLLDDYISEEMVEMGYDKGCVRVLPCTRKRPS